MGINLRPSRPGRRVAVSAAAAVAVAALAAGCSSGGGSSSGGGTSAAGSSAIPAGPIKLGAILTTSGPNAEFGLSEEAQLNAYAGLVNAAGGIDGHQVQIVVENDQGNPTVAAQLALQFVQQKVAGVVYNGIPASEQQAAPILNKYKILQITPDYAGLSNAAKYPYMFATNPNAVAQMVPLAEYAKSKGWNKIAVLTDGSTFGTDLVQPFEAEAKKLGITITATITFPPTAAVVTTQITQAKASGANTVAVLATGGYGAVWTSMKSVGWNPNILTTDITKYDDYQDMGSYKTSAVVSCWEPAYNPGQAVDSAIAADLTTVQKAVPGLPLASLQNAPDYALPIAAFKAAIKQANSTNPDKLKAVLESWTSKNVMSPLNALTFSAGNHTGRGLSQTRVCTAAKQGPMGLDYVVANPSQ
jgi:ABC-type branched-subunit amino acid transport system substrate-binding protein